ncbi:MAG: hypothetical protein ACOVLE_15040, partial [Pirellula staleyi]
YQQAGAIGSNVQGLLSTAPVHSAPQMQLPQAASDSVGVAQVPAHMGGPSNPGASSTPPSQDASGVNSNLRR